MSSSFFALGSGVSGFSLSGFLSSDLLSGDVLSLSGFLSSGLASSAFFVSDFKSAGPHFNPDGKKHGLDNPDGPHAGDMPNFIVEHTGKSKAVVTASNVNLGNDNHSVFSNGGTALVIHAKPDDMKTDPAGNAGDRIACGAGTDHLPADRAVTLAEVVDAYAEQCAFVERCGGRIILMASRVPLHLNSINQKDQEEWKLGMLTRSEVYQCLEQMDIHEPVIPDFIR